MNRQAHLLARLLTEGDDEIYELVNANIGLAGVIARDFFGQSDMLPDEDVLATAKEALVRAAHGWDPTYGVPFKGYARRAIRNNLIHLMNTEMPYARKMKTDLDTPGAYDPYSASMSRYSADDGEGSASDVSQSVTKGNQAWDNYAGEAPDANPEDVSKTADALKKAMSQCSDQEQYVLKALMMSPPLTYREIAKKMGVSFQRVNAIIRPQNKPHLFEKLRRLISAMGFKNAIDGILIEAADTSDTYTDGASVDIDDHAKASDFLKKLNNALLNAE